MDQGVLVGRSLAGEGFMRPWRKTVSELRSRKDATKATSKDKSEA